MIYSYEKFTDEYTTYTLVEPDYNLLNTDSRITELSTIDGLTYVHVPDDIVLPEQSEQIKGTIKEVILTDELKELIKNASSHVDLIRKRVVDKIRQKYTIEDEIKFLRTGLDTDEGIVYNAYVEECRAWGNTEKAKLGL